MNRPDAPWGTSRISRNEPLDHVSDGLLYPYKFDSSAGKGVDIYIVDTGIYTEHVSSVALYEMTFILTQVHDT